jgi:hypothetical protein
LREKKEEATNKNSNHMSSFLITSLDITNMKRRREKKINDQVYLIFVISFSFIEENKKKKL